MIWLMLSAGAVVGVLARFGAFQAFSPLTALLAVNCCGSFIAGLCAQKVLNGGPAWLGPLVIVGFCGTLTTFSTYALELVKLLGEGQFFKVACHFFLNNAACLFLCYVGYFKIQLT